VNQAVEKNLNALLQQGVQVIWQSGKLYFSEYKKYSETEGVQVHEFVQKMDLLYAAADIIVSRAGAGSISELCIVGKPVVFIPSPNVAEDHQTKNAESITNQQAAILLKESEISTFSACLAALIKDESKQMLLAKNIKKLALPDATKQIADEVEKILK